jgi:hypothetical protein
VKTLLYILLIVASPFVIFVLIGVGYAVYLSVTGKDKSPEIQKKIADLKERKAKKKKVNKIAHSENFPINNSSAFLPSWWDD